jgi:glycosyltransferase involved in cell wall biosynthesis
MKPQIIVQTCRAAFTGPDDYEIWQHKKYFNITTAQNHEYHWKGKGSKDIIQLDVRRPSFFMVFSVIVPFLNEELYIERCIRSLLNQDFPPSQYELLFVDNNSTDQSATIVRKYPRITLLEEKKPNVYAARNRALAVAKGEIIAFTDADCEASGDWLGQIQQGMQLTNASIVLGKRCFPVKSSTWLRMFENYENEKINYLLTYLDKKYFFAFTNNMAIKAKLFNEFGQFEQLPVTGDTEFMQRYVSRSSPHKVYYLDRMVVRHLEVNGVWDWLKKMYLYGEQNVQIQKRWNYKTLTFNQKWRIYLRAVKKGKYNFFEIVIFLILLIIGDYFYGLGKRRSL